MGKLNDFTGQRFGRLLVLSLGPKNYIGKSQWNCACDCGVAKLVAHVHLSGGVTRSCGCLRTDSKRESIIKRNRARTRHGATAGGTMTLEYRAWASMQARCYDKKSCHYFRYGGRGIAVHPEWRISGGFERFLAHIGPKPEPNQLYSLDRIDTEGNYESGNVRWATREEQARNRRSRTAWPQRRADGRFKEALA